MIREMSALEARKNFGEILNEVKYRHDHVLITKTGKPVAALIDVGLFDKIRMMRSRFNAMTAELGNVYEGVSEKEAYSEIKEALDSVKSS